MTPEGDAVPAANFWAAVAALDPELADGTEDGRARRLVESAYGDDGETVDAAHLLHDLRLWPGVEEAEHWNQLADELRSKLCSGAAPERTYFATSFETRPRTDLRGGAPRCGGPRPCPN